MIFFLNHEFQKAIFLRGQYFKLTRDMRLPWMQIHYQIFQGESLMVEQPVLFPM